MVDMFPVSDIATYAVYGIALGVFAHTVGWSFRFLIRRISALLTI